MWHEILSRYEGLSVTDAFNQCLKDRVGFIRGSLQVGHQWFGIDGCGLLHYGSLDVVKYNLYKPVVSFGRHFTIHWSDRVFDHRRTLPGFTDVSQLDGVALDSFNTQLEHCLEQYSEQIIDRSF